MKHIQESIRSKRGYAFKTGMFLELTDTQFTKPVKYRVVFISGDDLKNSEIRDRVRESFPADSRHLLNDTLKSNLDIIMWYSPIDRRFFCHQINHIYGHEHIDKLPLVSSNQIFSGIFILNWPPKAESRVNILEYQRLIDCFEGKYTYRS